MLKPIPTPEFDALRQSLKDFLSNQDVLKDYDYEGSTMSIILDMLSYNTYINAFYLHMTGNEAFLTSAIKRDSVVAKATELGYTPRSITSSFAFIDVTLYDTLTDKNFVIIPRNTVFTARQGQKVYNFRTIIPYTAVKISPGVFKASNVKVHEGRLISQKFAVDGVNVINSVTLQNSNIDTSILRVLVSEQNNPNEYAEFKPSKDITTQDKNSRSYYLEEGDGGTFTIRFGDDALSKAIKLGDTVIVDYVMSLGPEANGVKSFSLDAQIGTDPALVETVSAANGGAEAETIESIKFNAPKSFEQQGRAVTANDYDTLVRQLSTDIDDVITKGGEDVFPPQYNKVVLYIKPKSKRFFTDLEKKALISGINTKSIVLTKAVILDPEYLYVNVSTAIDYSPTDTPLSEADFKNKVSTAISNFSNENLNKFSRDVRYSVFLRFIDTIDNSIISNNTQLQVEKQIIPEILTTTSYDVNFSAPLIRNTLTSSSFSITGYENCFFQDNNGQVRILSAVGSDIITVSDNAGTIDYNTGAVSIEPLQILTVTETSEFFDADAGNYFIKFLASVNNNNINQNSDQIVLINNISVSLNPILGYK